MFRLLLNILVLVLVFLCDVQFGEVVYCSDGSEGDIPDLLDSDSEGYYQWADDPSDVFRLRLEDIKTKELLEVMDNGTQEQKIQLIEDGLSSEDIRSQFKLDDPNSWSLRAIKEYGEENEMSQNELLEFIDSIEDQFKDYGLNGPNSLREADLREEFNWIRDVIEDSYNPESNTGNSNNDINNEGNNQ